MSMSKNPVRVRYASGDEVLLVNCPTVNRVKVEVATLCDTFAPDVTVIGITSQFYAKLDDDEALPPHEVIVVLSEQDYDDALWRTAILAHAKALDANGIKRAMVKVDRDCSQAKLRRGETLCGDVLIDAASKGMSHAVQILLLANASVNHRDEYGRTPLIYAADNGHAHLTQILINAGAHVNAKDKDGNSALSYSQARDLFDTGSPNDKLKARGKRRSK